MLWGHCLKHGKKLRREHYVKSVQIQRFFWFVFSCISTEYGDLLRKSLYSAWVQEYVDQKKTPYSDTSHAEQSINNKIEFDLYEFKELTQNYQFLY